MAISSSLQGIALRGISLSRGRIGRLGLLSVMVGLMAACAPSPIEPEGESSATPEADAAPEAGMLVLTANGEDFVRQGFVSKDGWAIAFDHLYLTVADVTAYQTDPPFDANSGAEIAADQLQKAVPLVEQQMVIDLAEGDDTADPIVVTTGEGPLGHYNAISWSIVPQASDAAAEATSIQLIGTASQGDRTIPFDLSLDPTYHYVCGDFIGDARKGFVREGEDGELEMTLHFDHIFGDGEAPADDEINTGALGFEPLLAAADNDAIVADMATLRTVLSEDDQAVLEKALEGLGHVGEGHCATAETALKGTGSES